MRVGGIRFASFVLLGCSITQAEPSAALGLHPEDVGNPKARAEKVLKVLESAKDHNARLERTEQQLFDQKE